MIWIGAAQFLIGVSLASWAVGRLDSHDVLYRFKPLSKIAYARTWAAMVAGFAIAGLSPITILMG